MCYCSEGLLWRIPLGRAPSGNPVKRIFSSYFSFDEMECNTMQMLSNRNKITDDNDKMNIDTAEMNIYRTEIHFAPLN